MRPVRWVCAVALAMAAAVAGAQPLDSVVARVDQSVVTWSQVLQERALRAWAREAEAEADARSVVEALVRRRLLVTEAQKMRIEVRPEEVAKAASALAAAGGDPTLFSGAVRRWGVSDVDVRRRCLELLLVRRYLSLREEMTYVPEADVRAVYVQKPEEETRKSLPEAREEIRVSLARKKYQRELEQWVSKQIVDGRVRYVDLPEGLIFP